MNWQAAEIKPRERIIIALDVPTDEAALALVRQLSPHAGLFKIGLQLYTAAGPDIVRAVHDLGGRIFLDLKLHDIPNTVGRAIESASSLGVEMQTIHLSGGRAMIEAAVRRGFSGNAAPRRDRADERRSSHPCARPASIRRWRNRSCVSPNWESTSGIEASLRVRSRLAPLRACPRLEAHRS